MTTAPITNTPSDAALPYARTPDSDHQRIRFIDVLPIAVIHAVALLPFYTGVSWVAAAVAFAFFWLRMFVITAFYHRYFSHRTFKVHRLTQALASALGTTCAQRGPVWWAAHHREHHQHTDKDPDPHSPGLTGLLFSHVGWFLTQRGQQIDWKRVPDWKKFPELVFIERHHMWGAFLTAGFMFGLGALLQAVAPSLNTSGLQMFAWGFGVSTVALYHATFTINSLAHTFGTQRFNTGDDSRNNWLLSLITLGEGWHNNHHYYPATARQGFYWYEFDPTYWALKALSTLGIVWDLRPVPQRVYEAAANPNRARQEVDRPPAHAQGQGANP